jgi:major prohead-scaffolding core protein gp22
LFDSIFESLSNVFVEHNLNVPTEQVDVYEELQQECDELQTKLDSLMKENKRLTVEAQESKVKDIIKEVTKNLTESQIEKVIALSE